MKAYWAHALLFIDIWIIQAYWSRYLSIYCIAISCKFTDKNPDLKSKDFLFTRHSTIALRSGR